MAKALAETILKQLLGVSEYEETNHSEAAVGI
jgi:hypothetical protein